MDHKDLLKKSGSDDADARGEHVYPTDPRARGEAHEAGTDRRGAHVSRRRTSYAAGADGTQQVPVEDEPGKERS